MYAVPDKINQADYALEAAVTLLEFYEDYFSIPYPLPKQGRDSAQILQIVVSSDPSHRSYPPNWHPRGDLSSASTHSEPGRCQPSGQFYSPLICTINF